MNTRKRTLCAAAVASLLGFLACAAALVERPEIIWTRAGGPSGSVRGLAFSPDKELLASAGRDRSNGRLVLVLWGVLRGRWIREIQSVAPEVCQPQNGLSPPVAKGCLPPPPSPLTARPPLGTGRSSSGMCPPQHSYARSLGTVARYGVLLFSRDGRTIASRSLNKTIKLWRVSDGELLKTYDEEESIHSTAFFPNRSLFAYGRFDGNLVVAKTRLPLRLCPPWVTSTETAM